MNFDIKKRLKRSVVLALIALCVGVGIGFYQVSDRAGSSIGGGFSLVHHDGTLIDETAFAGRYKLIYFGFTYCPAICPTELQKITQVMKKLGAAAEQIQPLFITIDPERDTAAVMRDYVALFDKRIVGLTGSRAQVDKVLKDYRVYANKVFEEGADEYMMDHSSYIYLMNAENQLLSIYSIDDDVAHIVKDVFKHL